ncbi:hypothetical protein KKD88_01500, partial [Patescibacteria group bacterium]|nr:hypothetical protein [Patescibacteria group bacterium]
PKQSYDSGHGALLARSRNCSTISGLTPHNRPWKNGLARLPGLSWRDGYKEGTRQRFMVNRL